MVYTKALEDVVMGIEKRVTDLVLEVLAEVNAQLPEETRVETTMESRLFGGASRLDSLSLVNLIVAVEQRIDEEFGVVVTLADEKAMSRKSSPFRTVGSLVEYVVDLLKDRQPS